MTFPIPGANECAPALIEYLQNIPEMRDEARGPRALKENASSSGFGALNEPSSYHNPAVRRIRRMIYNAVHEVMRAVVAQAGLCDHHFEQLIDRLLYRQVGQTVPAESAHRDEATSALAGDLIFGGWMAFSDLDRFTFSPGTHRDAQGELLPAAGNGFSKIPKASASDYPLTTVAIPQGHFVMFFANIAHVVRPSKRKTPLLRLFAGHRLTLSRVSLNHWGASIRLIDYTRVKVPEPPKAVPAPLVVAAGGGGACSSKRKRGSHAGSLKRVRMMKGVESPPIRESMENFLVVTLPSGQHFPIISRFAYSMQRKDKNKYKWVCKRFKSELFGFEEWPEEPVPWEAIAYMDPVKAQACCKAAGYPSYSEAEMRQHVPQAFV